jgi:hypothetical protein
MYVSKVGYDAWGRVLGNSYQRNSDALKDFGFRYNDKGYLSQLLRGTQPIWNGMAQDAAGRPTQIGLGHGLTQTMDCCQPTGRLKRAQLADRNSRLVLGEGYEYDAEQWFLRKLYV